MKNHIKSALFLLAGLGLLGACAASNPVMRTEIAQRLAAPAWMIKREIAAAPLTLTAYERMHERFAPANIYIEGDGTAKPGGYSGLYSPTPLNPVALHLATRDKADNLVWLARPCQYSSLSDSAASCRPYWSGQQFSPEVLQAYNNALDDIKKRYDITDFNLIGFDGGAAVAALLAAQRDDVVTLRSVAGNLDHTTYSAVHGLAPLDGSLNPVEFSDRLRSIPQIHFIGGQDKIVPPTILHSYLQALGSSNCVQYKLIQEAEHNEGWVDKWPGLMAERPICRGPVEEIVFDDFEFPEPIKIQREAGKGAKGK